jgi:hypothetical protein
MFKDVRWFEIPVENAELDQGQEAVQNIQEHSLRL